MTNTPAELCFAAWVMLDQVQFRSKGIELRLGTGGEDSDRGYEWAHFRSGTRLHDAHFPRSVPQIGKGDQATYSQQRPDRRRQNLIHVMLKPESVTKITMGPTPLVVAEESDQINPWSIVCRIRETNCGAPKHFPSRSIFCIWFVTLHSSGTCGLRWTPSVGQDRSNVK